MTDEVEVTRDIAADLDRRRVLALAKVEAFLRPGAEISATDRDRLRDEVLMALGIEDEGNPEIMAEVIIEMDGDSGHGILDRLASQSRSSSIEAEAKRQFHAGYLIAVSNLVNLHGAETEAADVLAELGVTEGIHARWEA